MRLTFEASPAAGRPEELTGRAVFVNEGDEEVSVMAMQLESPSLALEVVDEAGAPVPLPRHPFRTQGPNRSRSVPATHTTPPIQASSLHGQSPAGTGCGLEWSTQARRCRIGSRSPYLRDGRW